MNIYLKLMRVDQYVKNIIVLLPLLFSGQLFEDGKIFPTLLGVLFFCLISSAVYLMNDIADADADARNPAKSHRPIPSGKVSKRNAYIMCGILAAIAIFGSFMLHPLFDVPLLAGAWVMIYFMINILYSLGLKDVIIVDVVMIVGGFIIRVFYGTLVADVTISDWLIVMIGCLVTFTTIGKRVNEKRRMKRNGIMIRKVLENVSEESLSVCLYLSLILLNIVFVIWITDIIPLCETNPLWTIPIMILFSYKCFVIIQNNQTDHDPLPLFVRDMIWILTFITLIASIVITFYVEVPIINEGVSIFNIISAAGGSL